MTAITLALFAALPAAAPPAPVKPAAGFDGTADVAALVQKAQAAARKDNRRVLVVWGSDSCEDSKKLLALLKTGTLSRTMLYEFDLVRADVGAGDKNHDVAGRFGADPKKHGTPCLTVLDPAGQSLATLPGAVFKEDGKDEFSATKVGDFLTRYAATPQRAEEVLAAGLAEADRSGRLVFLHFGAPWCGWCHRLEDWMARPDVAAVLGKDFVDLKIDTDRMTGGKELLKRYNATAAGGIPWFVFLDGKGQAVIDSVGPKGNVGFPYEDAEVEHFVKMLQTAKRKLTDADIELLRKSLARPAKE